MIQIAYAFFGEHVPMLNFAAVIGMNGRPVVFENSYCE